MGDVLLWEREPLNSVDNYAVAVVKSGTVVRHVPRRCTCFALFFFSFSNQKSELGRGRSHGTKVNRGAGTVLKYREYIASTEKGLLKTAVEEIERLRK